MDTPILISPTQLLLPKVWVQPRLSELRKSLSFTNTSIGHQLRKWKNVLRFRPEQHWFVRQRGMQALLDQISDLEKKYHRVALFEFGAGGDYWTYSGFAHSFEKKYLIKIERGYDIPEPRPIEWKNPPKFPPRDFQDTGADLLINAGHAALELATGMGKSYVIALLLKRLGLPAVVVTPNLSIGGQLFRELEHLFGKDKVGRFYGGKKEPEKLFTVAVDDSLKLVKKDSPNWNPLAKKSVVIFDESHLIPAETLERVCLDLLGNVPYRCSLSGTQGRSDGLDLVLDGLIGPILMNIPLKEGVKRGVLTKPRFFKVATRSDVQHNRTGDAMKILRTHLHENDLIYKQTGLLVRRALHMKKRVLIFIDQVEQFKKLYPQIKDFNFGFAHGPLTKANKPAVPEQYHKSDPDELVSQFDAGEFPILIGTSCIGIGTDIKSAMWGIDLVGTKAENKFRQQVGRLSRLFEGKDEFYYFYFDVENVELLHKHAGEISKICKDIYSPPDSIRLGI